VEAMKGRVSGRAGWGRKDEQARRRKRGKKGTWDSRGGGDQRKEGEQAAVGAAQRVLPTRSSAPLETERSARAL
jgi:hypothetical protein